MHKGSEVHGEVLKGNGLVRELTVTPIRQPSSSLPNCGALIACAWDQKVN